MLIILIKNNLKLMLRSKLILLMMIVTPILVIAALSNSFHGLLNNGYEMEKMTIGYYFEQDSLLAQFEDEFKAALEEEGITLEQYGSNDMENAIQKGQVDSFLYASANKYQIASQDVESIQTRVCQYAVQMFLEEYDISALNIERVTEGEDALDQVNVVSEKLTFTKTAEAEDYYGIIEIIYFMWCGLIFLTAVAQGERKNKLQKRFIISPASGVTLYLGKLIPCELMTVASIFISALVSTLLFDIHWGNLAGTIGILFLVSLAATAFGILLLYLVNNLAVSVILLFIFVWVSGYLGGSFETYMYSSTPEFLKRLSPIYYANRTVVEFSTMGHSSYTTGCIFYMVGIFVVSMLIGCLLMKRRMEEN